MGGRVDSDRPLGRSQGRTKKENLEQSVGQRGRIFLKKTGESETKLDQTTQLLNKNQQRRIDQKKEVKKKVKLTYITGFT